LAHNDNKHARNIVDLQVHQRDRFYRPLLPFSSFTKYIHNYTFNTTEQDSNNINNIRFLRMFIDQLDKIHVLKHISILVKFYHYLNNDVAKRVTYATSPDIEFPACLHEALNKEEDIKQWVHFSEAWADIFFRFT
jgi:hypothetical protein